METRTTIGVGGDRLKAVPHCGKLCGNSTYKARCQLSKRPEEDRGRRRTDRVFYCRRERNLNVLCN